MGSAERRLRRESAKAARKAKPVVDDHDPRHVEVLKQTVWIEGTTQSNEAAAVIIEP